MAARGLLTRGPPSAEPSEAHAKGVPVGKRTVLEVQEKVAPQRAGRVIVRGCRTADRPRVGRAPFIWASASRVSYDNGGIGCARAWAARFGQHLGVGVGPQGAV